MNASIGDLEISSTAVAGRLHMTTGIGTTQTYRYTDIPATVTSGAGWNAPVTAFPSFNDRCEMGCRGNVLYALPCDPASNNVPNIYKSTDGGANWAATATQPGGGTWANGQGWYSLSCGINPANTNECIVGGLDCYKTSDGGTTWTKITSWATSTTGFYVHADQHNIQWWDGGTKLLFGCDGGVHFSTNGGTTNSDRNKGLRLKQFYSVAIHPTETNFFIGGAQDNGMHRLNHPGLDSSAEVVGGDGCYSAIDQNEPQYQFGTYVYNVYRRSTNNGSNWSTPVSLATDGSNGRFVNPWDYDNVANIVYACYTTGTYLRWDNPQTGGTTTTVTATGFTGNVSAVHASPYTANKVYFGMGTGGIFYVNNANTGTTVTATSITPSGSSGYVNCVVTGSSDQNLIATYSSYSVNNVWVSTNGGTSWTAIDGNLPDMPVRWALFHPDTDTKAYIATETGVWETDLINGASTVWTPNISFPTVRTDMIKFRASDRTIAAGTHGRGIWTTNVFLPISTAQFRTKASGNFTDGAIWEYNNFGTNYIDAAQPPGPDNNIIIRPAHTVTLNVGFSLNAGKTLTDSGRLNCGTNILNGTGTFTLPTDGTLGIGSLVGISSSGATGNIQTTTRTFATTANYTYSGAANQATGNGLPPLSITWQLPIQVPQQTILFLWQGH